MCLVERCEPAFPENLDIGAKLQIFGSCMICVLSRLMCCTICATLDEIPCCEGSDIYFQRT